MIIKIQIIYVLFLNKKITFRKIINAIQNILSYLLHLKVASRSPTLLIIEPTNKCNMSCQSCRSDLGVIHDHYFIDKPKEIPQGVMTLDLYSTALEKFKPDLFMSVLYLQGEPLLNKDLCKMIKLTTDAKVGSMLATNGMLLSNQISREILTSGLDFIKIPVSGFSQEIYSKHHVKGNIEVIKKNIESLVNIKRELKSNIIIMIDYFLFDYNREEEILFKKYSEKLNIYFMTRIGDPPVKGKFGNIETSLVAASSSLCPWPWNILVLDWNGNVLPCNQFSKSSSPFIMGNEKVNLELGQFWNSDHYQEFRRRHIREGRGHNFLCNRCDINAIGFRPREK